MKKQLITLGSFIVLCYACHGPHSSSQNDTSQIAPSKIDTALQHAPNQNAFASAAAMGNLMEVESSAKMIKYTENPDVQTLATIMVKDHVKANEELMNIAKKEKVAMSQTLPEQKLKQLAILDSLQEDERNIFYSTLMVAEHRTAVALFEKATKSEQNPAFLAFAKKQLPILKHHLMEAENVNKIMNKIKGDKGDQPLDISRKKI
jgi:putative membrane protein